MDPARFMTGMRLRRKCLGLIRTFNSFPNKRVLWKDGGIYDLNDLIIPGSGLELYETHAINDQGVIAGNALPPGWDDVHVCARSFTFRV